MNPWFSCWSITWSCTTFWGFTSSDGRYCPVSIFIVLASFLNAKFRILASLSPRFSIIYGPLVKGINHWRFVQFFSYPQVWPNSIPPFSTYQSCLQYWNRAQYHLLTLWKGNFNHGKSPYWPEDKNEHSFPRTLALSFSPYCFAPASIQNYFISWAKSKSSKCLWKFQQAIYPARDRATTRWHDSQW